MTGNKFCLKKKGTSRLLIYSQGWWNLDNVQDLFDRLDMFDVTLRRYIYTAFGKKLSAHRSVVYKIMYVSTVGQKIGDHRLVV